MKIVAAPTKIIDIRDPEQQADAIYSVLDTAQLEGFSGNCGIAAIAINRVLFEGKGEFYVAYNAPMLRKNQFLGHVAVLYNGHLWDAEGETNREDLEAWGMLDPADSSYEEFYPDWDEKLASEVVVKEVDEDWLLGYFGTTFDTTNLPSYENRLRNAKRQVKLAELKTAADYRPMFKQMLELEPQFKTTVDENIAWAKEHLRKQDRITWYLRYFRVVCLVAMKKNAVKNRHADKIAKYEQLMETELKSLSARTGTSMTEAVVSMINMATLRTHLDHYLSINTPKIQDVVWDKQTAPQLLEDFRNAEQQWKDEQAKHLEPQDEDTIVVQFDNGWAWWLLDRAYCEEEGRAMGHCGNVNGQYNTEERILSLRQPGGHGRWMPHLTFILDENGYLGEMKGRGNEKPAEKYHDYIVALLKDTRLVKGIKGGGYLPAHNFRLNDLNSERHDEVKKHNPAAMSSREYLKQVGPDEKWVARMEDALNISQGKWDAERKHWVIDSWETPEDFLNHNLTSLNDWYEMVTEIDDSEPDDIFVASRLIDVPAVREALKLMIASMSPEQREAILQNAKGALGVPELWANQYSELFARGAQETMRTPPKGSHLIDASPQGISLLLFSRAPAATRPLVEIRQKLLEAWASGMTPEVKQRILDRLEETLREKVYNPNETYLTFVSKGGDFWHSPVRQILDADTACGMVDGDDESARSPEYGDWEVDSDATDSIGAGVAYPAKYRYGTRDRTNPMAQEYLRLVPALNPVVKAAPPEEVEKLKDIDRRFWLGDVSDFIAWARSIVPDAFQNVQGVWDLGKVMQKFNELFPAVQPKQSSKKTAAIPPTSVMYHVSRWRNRKSIMRLGLEPRIQEFLDAPRKPGIYMMETLEQANDWAYYFADCEALCATDVWEVRLPEGYEVEPETHPEMTDIYDAWIGYQTIPPENLRIVRTWKKQDYHNAPAPPKARKVERKTAGQRGHYLYHGMPNDFLESILKDGFVSEPSFWGTLDIARYYATNDECILRVPLSRFDQTALGADENMVNDPLAHTLWDNITGGDEAKVFAHGKAVYKEWQESAKTWQDSLRLYGAVVYDKALRVSEADILMSSPKLKKGSEYKTSSQEKLASGKWYHGTSLPAAASIMGEGYLLPSEDEDDSNWTGSLAPRYGAVYITTNFNLAKEYAVSSDDGDPMVIEVAVPDPQNLIPDEDSITSALKRGNIHGYAYETAVKVRRHWLDWYNDQRDTTYDMPSFDSVFRPWFMNDMDEGWEDEFADVVKHLAEFISQRDKPLAADIIDISGRAAHLGKLKAVAAYDYFQKKVDAVQMFNQREGEEEKRVKTSSESFREWFKDTKMYPITDAHDLKVQRFKSMEEADAEPFMDKYTLYRGTSTFHDFNGQERTLGFYVVCDGDKPIASFSSGALVVDKGYRGQGIATNLASEFLKDFPQYRPRSANRKSKRVFERAWNTVNKKAADWKAELLGKLQALPYANDISVFGSVGRGKENPNDIDLVLDLRGQDWLRHPSRIDLLRLANDFMGHLDPFLLTDKGLFTCNESATGWVASRNQPKMLKNMAEQGVNLANLATSSLSEG